MTAAPQGDRADVLSYSETFEEVDGRYQFTRTLVVYQIKDNMYHAISKLRYARLSDIRTEHLTEKVLIPVEAYRPLFLSHLTRVPDPPPSELGCYVKRPRLISYDRHGPQPNIIAESFLAEVKVCELLRRHPHPNIASYLGCQVLDGRIAGICFVRYHSTLMGTVNPGHHGKRALRSLRLRQGERENYGRVLDGVERGLHHLHSLGLVHNDINPMNIMLHNGTGIIIDFGSCRTKGESIQGVGRTYEWYDEAVGYSTPRNDFDALEEMRIWLGNGSKEFQFDE